MRSARTTTARDPVRAFSSALCRLSVDRRRAAAHDLERELLLDPLPAALPEPGAQDGVAGELGECTAQRVGIPRRYGQAGLAVPVYPGHTRRQPRADDRLSARHRLELHVPERLRTRDR